MRRDNSGSFTGRRLIGGSSMRLEKPDLHNRRSSTCGLDANSAMLPERQDVEYE
jgi:hypothetical protein